MATVKMTERRLAVTTNWGLFGSFAVGSILTGFGNASVPWGIAGFAVLIIGLVAHVIINRMYRTGFSNGEIILGFIVFGVAALSFLAAWIFDPEFGRPGVVIGLVGFGAIIASFLTYIVLRFGLRGAFSMFHEIGTR